jgi:hypothetical protein
MTQTEGTCTLFAAVTGFMPAYCLADDLHNLIPHTRIRTYMD